MADTEASSSAAMDITDFVEDLHAPLEGAVINGIASGLQAKGYRTVCWQISNDKGKCADMHVEKVLVRKCDQF